VDYRATSLAASRLGSPNSPSAITCELFAAARPWCFVEQIARLDIQRFGEAIDGIEAAGFRAPKAVYSDARLVGGFMVKQGCCAPTHPDDWRLREATSLLPGAIYR
jgi:hypothetical protein